MTNTFEFNSRETYIAYRADWKARYKAISNAIRTNKQAQRNSTSNDEVGILQSRLHYMRVDATQMMAELAEAKAFKNEQLRAVIA